MTVKERVFELVDGLPAEKLPEAERFLESLMGGDLPLPISGDAETQAFRKMLARIRAHPAPGLSSEEIDAIIARERRAARAERDARGR